MHGTARLCYCGFKLAAGVIVAGCLLSILTTANAQATKPRIAVTTLENPTTGSTIGNGLTEILITTLQKTGRLQLVDRGAAEQATTVGVDFLIKGKVTNFSFNEQAFTDNVATPRGMVLQTRYRQNATVRVDFQVLRASTGEIVIAEPASATETRVSATTEELTYRRLLQSGSFSAESRDSLIGRATTRAIDEVVRKITDLSGKLSDELSERAAADLSVSVGRITAVQGDTQFVDLGAKHGLHKGSRLTAFTEKVTKNQKGQVVFREEQETATLEVVALDASGGAARTRVLSITAQDSGVPREGDVVRVASVSAASPMRGSTEFAVAVVGDAERFVKEGDRNLEDGYFGEAIGYYEKALGFDSSATAIMDRLGSAFLRNRQLRDAEDQFKKVINLNGVATFVVLHNHGFGSCAGILSLSKGELLYEPFKGDDQFRVPKSAIVSVGERDVPMRGDSDLTSVQVVVRNAAGKEKSYDFVLSAFLKGGAATRPPTFHATNIYSHQSGLTDERTLEDTARAHRMLVRLLQEMAR